MDTKQFFRTQLMAWFAQNHRPLPWKGEKDPYKIWLSEIILQQTRAEQGLPYYQKFAEKYPTVRQLADAPEDEVLKLWEGLGYYARARNLHFTARFIAKELNGQFPSDYDRIRDLKGVGDYTAAAIASFAFDLPHAVLDGNVFRVLARYFGIETPTDTPVAKREFQTRAQNLLDLTRPGAFNQAIMDFGATHCTPEQPKCLACPLQSECIALRLGKVGSLPVKSKVLEKKERFFVFLVANFQGDTFVRKRVKKDIWQNLYEFPLLELPTLPTDNQDLKKNIQEYFFHEKQHDTEITLSRPYRQILTHRLVTAIFCEMTFPDGTAPEVFDKQPFENCLRVSRAALKKNVAVPRIIDWYLQEKTLTLTLF